MEGKKFDSDKDPWDLLPKSTVAKIVKVLAYGAKKYEPENWKVVPNARSRYYAAAMRHLEAWWNGEVIDVESNLPHLAHAACCLLFLMWFDMENKQ